MKITEAEDGLPNGLHDAEFLGFEVDYTKKTATLEFAADYSDPENVRDEPDRKVRLMVPGLHFISVPAPDLGNKYSAGENSMVSGFHKFEESHAVSEETKEAVKHLPAAAFCECTFVNDWNRCLVIAAEDARIEIEQ